MKSIFCFLILFVMLGSSALAVSIRENDSDTQPGDITNEDLIVIDMYDESDEGMLKTSSLAVHAIVRTVKALDDAIIPEDPEDRRGGGLRTQTVIKKVAVLDVKHIYKGSFSGKSISIIFRSPSVQEDPPPVEFFEGEDVIVFLMPSPVPPHYATITSSTGKLRYNLDLDKKLKELTGTTTPATDNTTRNEVKNTNDPAGKVTLNISVQKAAVKAGDPVFVTVLLMNNSDRPVRADTSLDPARILKMANPQNEPVSPLPTHRQLGQDIRTVAPDHFIGARYNLAEVFYMGDPGVYTIRGSIWPMTSGEPEMLLSSPVSITVSE